MPVTPGLRNSRTPSPDRYRSMLILEAQRGGLDPGAVLSHQRKRGLCYARFQVWRKLKSQGFSLPGIGRAASRDHTSILYGIRKITMLENMAWVVVAEFFDGPAN